MSPLHLIDVGVALPELFLGVGAMVLLMIGAFVGEKSTKLVTVGAVAILLVTLLITVTADFGDGLLAFNGLFRADSFGVFMKAIVLVASAVSLILSQDYFERAGIARFEFPVLVVLATLGMMLMISANDLISLYVGLELQSLALYVVASINRDDMRSTEAGLKYFVLGALSSGMLLYGSSLVYGFAGTTNFDGIARLLTDMPHAQVGVVIGLVLIIAGLAFKISAVPFHMWTPDVYEGAPTPVTAFFASAPKVAAISLFVRVLIGPFGEMADQWQQVLEFVSVASMILGALAAINQTNIKRLMAYSSIGHMGYALIGLASASPGGVSGIVTYMAIYVVMGLGTFAVILSMRTQDGPVEKISDLAGLSRNSPMLAAALAIFMFSMAGIPPLAGFFGKLFVFQAAVEAKLYVLAVIGVLSSVVGAFYYLRIVKVMYFDEPAPKFVPAARGVSIVTGASALLTLLFFVVPAPLVSGAYTVAARLFGG